MKVWVDCTAAAHPLVLRPIIERLEARGDEVFVTAREYGQTEGSSSGSGSRTRRSGATPGPGPCARAPRSPVARRGWRASSGGGAPTWRSPTARSTSPSSPPSSGSPPRRCRTTSSRGCSARSPSGPPAGCSSPTRSRSSAWPGSAPRGRSWSATRASRRSTTWPASSPTPACSRSSGSTARRSWSSSARRRRPPSTTPATTSTARRSPAWRGAEGAQAVVDPPHRAPARRGARRSAPSSLIVPERAIDAQSLIAFADLVVSAGGTMNREAVALGTPVFTTFTGRMGGVDEALIADGPPAGARGSRRPRAAQARDARSGVLHAARPGPAGRGRARRCRGRSLA